MTDYKKMKEKLKLEGNSLYCFVAGANPQLKADAH